MAIEHLGFHVTDRCQLDCAHCLRDPAQKPKDLPVDFVRRVIADARRLHGVPHIVFTGGEPLLHPEFPELVDAAVDQGCRWHLVTNGRRMPDLLQVLAARPERREGFTAPTFSLDGATEVVHDGIRGAGSYRDVMRAITLSVGVGLKFCLQMVVHARNQHEIEAIGMLASNLGADRLSFAPLLATGTHLDATMYLSQRQLRGVEDRIDRLAHALHLPVLKTEGFYRETAFHTCGPMSHSQLHVDIDGNLNLCCQHSGVPQHGARRDVGGDLREVSFVEAHARIVDIIAGYQRDKLGELARGELEPWDHHACNHCMKAFGRPFWSDRGAEGAQANRERWRGTWKKSLPVVS